MSATFDLSGVEVLTFDCYGTLIDWEAGLISAMRRAIPAAAVDDEVLLAEYGAEEAALEAGPYLSYREISARSMSAVARAHGIQPTKDAMADFGGSVVDWPAFPDSRDALAALAQRFELGVITNCDDDLFAASDEKLGQPFRWVITAQQARSYKPSPRNFELAFEQIGGSRQRIVHVAQSLYHDHVPAKRLGLRTIWVNRRHDRPGAGATPPAEAAPDLVVNDMATLARLAADVRMSDVTGGERER